MRLLPPLVTLGLVACSQGPPETTNIVFDGHVDSIVGDITCVTQPDGSLLILANGEDRSRMRVVIQRKSRLVVERVSLRVGDAGGYADNPAEMWATKVGDTYTISGRMPPNDDETAAHQFEIETRCASEVPRSLVRQPVLEPGGFGHEP